MASFHGFYIYILKKNFVNENKFLFFLKSLIFSAFCFQRAFLQSRSVSLVDMYIDNSEPSENVGQIQFSLEYDFQNTNLIVRIIQVISTQIINDLLTTHFLLADFNPLTCPIYPQ